MNSVEDKIIQAKDLLRDVMRPDGVALAWTGGKDSTLALWLAREVCLEMDEPLPPSIFIDDGDHFSEIEGFMAEVAGRWGARVERVANREVLARVKAVGDALPVAELPEADRATLAALGYDKEFLVYDPESLECSAILKTEPLKRHLREKGVQTLITAIRRDEHPARAGESAVSRRVDPPHMRVHPLLEFTEREVWAAIRSRGLPFCELYRWGFRSIGARSSTHPVSDLPAWEQDMEHTPERAGRHAPKEAVMARLRSLGYM